MSRQMAKRLDRLEARTDQARRYQLVVRYYGDPEPETDDTWTLVVWVHQPWCPPANRAKRLFTSVRQ